MVFILGYGGCSVLSFCVMGFFFYNCVGRLIIFCCMIRVLGGICDFFIGCCLVYKEDLGYFVDIKDL